ncbi:clan AA aspartic protease [Hymenobacter sp. RP-2-7]|uniref:Clan AA aspartic protease n=1 Tax=Hymenobacter polaris TaxID=2682546 RepID=A0A7Y0FKY2_9BACT|nr:clan AA aspartic protease [Hymenobacter polaris]NML63809.1 clan AA aspartic protease [Hymenobacter polaris]
MKHLLLIVLLHLAFQGAAQPNVLRDTIPFKMNAQNNMYVRAVFNKADTLNLNFDTGTTELVLINSVRQHKLKSAPTLYSTVYDLKIGATTYRTKVYDAELTAHETDGRFGWDLFKGKVVELDYDKNLLIVHAALPPSVAESKRYTKLPLAFEKDLLLITGALKQSGVVNTASFLFDSGYQRTAMLDDELLKQSTFPTDQMPLIKKVVMHGAQGNEIPVLTKNLAVLQLGKFKLKNVPVQQLTGSKLFKNKHLHILGNEVLKRFNTFLDLQAGVVYLKPNHYFRTGYIERKPAGA